MTSASSPLPPNVRLSTHPCLQAKLSQLRSSSTSAKDTKQLVHDISTVLGVEALAGLPLVHAGQDTSPLSFSYPHMTIDTSSITLVPILRSGLSMLDAVQSLLPQPASVHHLGLFRDKASLQPVEYYNNLPQSSSSSTVKMAIIVDPVIATGGTACAAIQTLREWGVERILVLSVLGARGGVEKAAEEWREGTEIWLGGLDEELTDSGMIKPGLGDIGDRLFLTIGK